jgi:3-phosphoshikimate 1-carboxyvinyltransferase
MALPDLIEIVPLDKPVRAEITVPGSKSITNRALILAALADGEVTLEGALWSEDTQIMVECLQELGFMVNVLPDPNEVCNRTITVYGKGGVVPPGGTEQQPMELFVGNAGTAARFLAAFVCLGKGVYRLHGVPRMHERPQAALFQALRELGCRVEAEEGNEKLPVRIYGKSEVRSQKSERRCAVSIEESSQFASALLLCAKIGGWQVEVTGENAEESPYVVMTSKMIEVFPHQGGKFQIEPDASSGSYFWGAAWLIDQCEAEGRLEAALKALGRELRKGEALSTPPCERSDVSVSIWPASGWQIDADTVKLISAGEPISMDSPKEDVHYRRIFLAMPTEFSREHDLGDSIMTLISLCPFNSQAVQFTDLGRLRVQECERVVALRTELTKCGAKVVEEGDTLTVYPSKLHGAVIETYNDHRMAMCFAILGLKVPGIKIKNPACVKKTFPNFFQKLAAPPPSGLGAAILDGKTGRRLTCDELFAK